MKGLSFTWDPKKGQSNLAKHGVSFPEAQTSFSDENARLIADPDHSQDEDRFILLGLSSKLRLLVVVHTYRQSESEIRIISARKATKKEHYHYSGYLS